MMRRVKIFKYEQQKKGEPTTSCKIFTDGEGWFLDWGVDFVQLDMSSGTYTVAIIERDNGKVFTVAANMIQFMYPGQEA